MNPSAKGARSMTAYLQELDYETLSKAEPDYQGTAGGHPRIEAFDCVGALRRQPVWIGNEDVLTSEKQMFETLESLT